MLIYPKPLKPGHQIGFVAPSSAIDDEVSKRVAGIFPFLEQLKLRPLMGPAVRQLDPFGVSAGSAAERAKEIHAMFLDPTVGAIWCIQGGDTANELLPLLDWDLIAAHPKIFMGLSDITVLLTAIHVRTGLVTFHAPDPKASPPGHYLGADYSREEFIGRMLEGRQGAVRPAGARRCLRKGRAEGRLIGGNLHCLLKLAGTPYWPDLSGAVLMVEGLSAGKPEAAAMLAQLESIGVFDQVAGLLIGNFSAFDSQEQRDREGRRIYFEDMALDRCAGYDFPILRVRDFGHRCAATFLPIGTKARIDAAAESLELTAPFFAGQGIEKGDCQHQPWKPSDLG